MLVKPIRTLRQAAAAEEEDGSAATPKDDGSEVDTWLRTSPIAEAYLAEVARVLRSGGYFFLVSLGSRERREPLLSATGALQLEHMEACEAWGRHTVHPYNIYIARRS